MGRAFANTVGAAVISAALVAGCGGSGGDGSSGNDFTAQVNKICVDGTAKLEGPNRVAAETGLGTPAALPALKEIDTVIGEQLAALNAVDPPADKADHFGKAVGAIQKQEGLIKELEGLLQKVSRAAPSNLQEGQRRAADQQRIQAIQTEIKLAAQETNDEIKALGASCEAKS